MGIIDKNVVFFVAATTSFAVNYNRQLCCLFITLFRLTENKTVPYYVSLMEEIHCSQKANNALNIYISKRHRRNSLIWDNEPRNTLAFYIIYFINSTLAKLVASFMNVL